MADYILDNASPKRTHLEGKDYLVEDGQMLRWAERVQVGTTALKRGHKEDITKDVSIVRRNLKGRHKPMHIQGYIQQ